MRIGDEPVDRSDLGEPVREAADDFLFHLYRGSELLMDDRVVEAKGELERALALQPQDAKGQDLLAGVYFRLGVYPRAIEIWQKLVAAFPRDAALNVNLALALLKTGQPTRALEHLKAALAVTPDHGKAWGYLGLTFWRLGRYEEARDAFLRGGQASMARRMDEVLGTMTTPGTLLAEATPSQAPPPAEEVDASRIAMRSAAELAIAEFEAEQVPLSIAPSRTRKPSGSWQIGEPGEEVVPRRVHLPRAQSRSAPPLLTAQLEQWAHALPDGHSLAVGPSGELFVGSTTTVLVRLEGMRAVRGELRTTPVARHVRGKDLDTLVGDKNPLMRFHGKVAAIFSPPEGRTFHALTLDDDVLFVREDVVFAVDEGLGFESGTLANDKASIPLMQLNGKGVVVLALRTTPSAISLGEGDEIFVAPDALVGWTGRLLPRGRSGRGTAPYAASAPPLSFRGEGVVIVS